jgi:hypothetical protein
MSPWITGRTVLLAALLSPLGMGLLATQAQAAVTPAPAIVTPAGPGPIISGQNTSKCVEDLGDSVRNNTPIVVSDCNGSPEQQWTIETDGTIQLNGKCLDVYRESKTNKAMIVLYTCHGSSNQQWQVDGDTLVNPVSRKCLDDPAYHVINGTQLQLFTCNGGRNQQWGLP